MNPTTRTTSGNSCAAATGCSASTVGGWSLISPLAATATATTATSSQSVPHRTQATVAATAATKQANASTSCAPNRPAPGSSRLRIMCVPRWPRPNTSTAGSANDVARTTALRARSGGLAAIYPSAPRASRSSAWRPWRCAITVSISSPRSVCAARMVAITLITTPHSEPSR